MYTSGRNNVPWFTIYFDKINFGEQTGTSVFYDGGFLIGR